MNLRFDHKCTDDSESIAAMSAGDDADRRQHARSLRVMRVARVAAPELHAEGLGMVRDVSPGGMMIDAHFDLALGQTVSIALLDDYELTGTVAWKEGRMHGIRFAEEIPVDQILAKPSIKPDGKRARLPRFTVHKAVQLRLDTAVASATLCDLSQRGAKLECKGKFRVHSNLLIRVAQYRPIGATIKWRAGEMIGVEFHRLMAISELEQWLKPDEAAR
jgi:PilZ domain